MSNKITADEARALTAASEGWEGALDDAYARVRSAARRHYNACRWPALFVMDEEVPHMAVIRRVANELRNDGFAVVVSADHLVIRWETPV